MSSSYESMEEDEKNKNIEESESKPVFRQLSVELSSNRSNRLSSFFSADSINESTMEKSGNSERLVSEQTIRKVNVKRTESRSRDDMFIQDPTKFPDQNMRKQILINAYERFNQKYSNMAFQYQLSKNNEFINSQEISNDSIPSSIVHKGNSINRMKTRIIDKFTTTANKKENTSPRPYITSMIKQQTPKRLSDTFPTVPPNCEISVDTIELSIGLLVKGFREAFMDFLTSEHSEENLEFWLDVQSFKFTILPEEIYSESKRIFQLFIAENCEKPINIDSHARNIVLKLIKYPNISMFDACEEQVYNLMKRDCLPRFLRTTYKTSSNDLPFFSVKNLNAISMVGSKNLAGSDECINSSRKMTLNISEHHAADNNNKAVAGNSGPTSMSATAGSNTSINDINKSYIIFPKFDEKFNTNRNSVGIGSVRLVVNDRNYTVPVKDGSTILDCLNMLNLTCKDFSNCLTFLHPNKMIIDFTQNSAYYSAKTIEVKRFSKIIIVIGHMNIDVQCPSEAPIGKIIETIANKHNLTLQDFSSIKNKSRKAPIVMVSSAGTLDKTTITCSLKKN